MALVRTVSSHRGLPLHEGWEFALSEPGRVAGPEQLEAAGLLFRKALVPGTAATSLRALGLWSFDQPRDFDGDEAWYRCRFADPGEAAEAALCFDGLATLCDAWLDGAPLLSSDNQFLAREAPLRPGRAGPHELVLRFSSVRRALAARKGRPRWKTRLVEQQQLRWLRTSLLGRIPGWTPRVAALGPWKPVRLSLRDGFAVDESDLRASLAVGGGAAVGRVTASLLLRPLGSRATRAFLEVGAARAPLQLEAEDGRLRLSGTAELPGVARWWPHTHGEQPLYPVRVVVEREQGEPVLLDCGQTGFRDLTVDRASGAFTVRVNGRELFCRGACWTTLDLAGLHATPADYRKALVQMREAGFNLVRVGGTMTYEDQAFHDLCDELGILVFQDFQFANLDYPVADAAFAASVREEARQFLSRTQLSPSLAVLCGGSEVEQQAAMMGLPPESWSGPLFQELLPSVCSALRPDLPYVSNSPTGGPLPFTVDQGLSHYYGVGAYRRPLEDARQAGLRFTSECLAFANVPEQATLDAFLGDGQRPPHHPRWKKRVPRDNATGWDFDDVRDHYLKPVYGVDPTDLRFHDVDRYLQLSRALTGELMAAAMLEWRRARSSCKGAVIWFLRDLWPGAGWGVVDARGRPKPALRILARALQPRAVHLADEGLSGLRLHLFNERPEELRGRARLVLYRGGETEVVRGEIEVVVPAQGESVIEGDALLHGFHDTTFAYRFGPPGHDLSVATLLDEAGAIVSQAFAFPLGRPGQREGDLGLSARLVRTRAGFDLVAKSRRFAQSVELELTGAEAADDWFHLEPGVEKRIALVPSGAGVPAVRLQPLNSHVGCKAALEAAP